jgi:hypothetical protein
VGVRAIDGNPNITLPSDVNEIFTDHYWQTDQPVNANLLLSQNGLGSFLNNATPVVIQADAVNGVGESLGGSFDGSFITSRLPATLSVLVIGKAPEFSVVIHDMITPYTPDEINDKLYIENIEQAPSNTVKLIDRWGKLVKEWKNFTNDISYDFSSLSPGTYICLVSYDGGSGIVNTQGMVTVLKSN